MSVFRSSRCTARRLVLLAFVAAVAWPAVAPRDAGAAVICQHPKKKQLVRLRADACKAREQTVFATGSVSDLSGQVAAASGQIARVETQAGEVRTVIGLECPGDPQRRLLTATRDLGGLLILLGYAQFSLCRTLDDDPAACGQSFEMGRVGAGACVYLQGKCLSCDALLDARGVCRNVCQPPLTCPAAPTRTAQVGDCGELTSQPACDQAWSLSSAYATPTDVLRGTTCYWNTSALPPECDECDPEATSKGLCSNSCIAPADLPRCRVGGRAFGDCDSLDGNPAACALTYQSGPYGSETCWYDAGPNKCNGCNPVDESKGKCTNGC